MCEIKRKDSIGRRRPRSIDMIEYGFAGDVWLVSQAAMRNVHEIEYFCWLKI